MFNKNLKITQAQLTEIELLIERKNEEIRQLKEENESLKRSSTNEYVESLKSTIQKDNELINSQKKTILDLKKERYEISIELEHKKQECEILLDSNKDKNSRIMYIEEDLQKCEYIIAQKNLEISVLNEVIDNSIEKLNELKKQSMLPKADLSNILDVHA